MSFIIDIGCHLYWGICGTIAVTVRYGFVSGVKFAWGALRYRYRVWQKKQTDPFFQNFEITFALYWPKFGDLVQFYLPGTDPIQQPPQEGIVLHVTKQKNNYTGEFIIKAAVFTEANSYGETIFEGIIIDVEVGSLKLVGQAPLEELLLHSYKEIREQAVLLTQQKQRAS